MEKINNDIYDITTTVNDLQRRYIPEEDPDTLALGTFGAIADQLSLSLQNSVITTGEMLNELFPARAKFERNIISHAIINNVDYINAVPAKIEIVLGIERESLDNSLINDRCTLDTEYAYNISGFEFHLEYDIIVTKHKMALEQEVYTAQYDISINNPLSDITNPYISAPFMQRIMGKDYVCFYTRLMQIQYTSIHKKIISSSIIENRTTIFEFHGQLASFMVKITDGDQILYLTPIFEGMGMESSLRYFCYYSYIDATHIRIRFDSLSYVPKISSNIDIIIKSTRGANGNFKYKTPALSTTISSDKYKYRSLPIRLDFASDSEGGLDRKSVAELRKILPKESLSRGSVICRRDLENYFSMINTDRNRLIVSDRANNQFERSYYTHLVLKDPGDNVIPTNTFDITCTRSSFDTRDNRKYVLKPGCYIVLNTETNKGEVIKYDTTTETMLDAIQANDRIEFLYTLPMMMIVDGDTLYVSYYMSIINTRRFLDFTYININSPVQFIGTSVSWVRNYITESNTYTMSLSLLPNTIASRDSLVDEDDIDGEMSGAVKAVVVFYNRGYDGAYRYAIMNSINGAITLSSSATPIDFELKLNTTDTINDNNQTLITNTLVPGQEISDYGYFDMENLTAKIYVCCKIAPNADGPCEYGVHDLDRIIPNLDGYTVTNIYTIDKGLPLYINYSSIIMSQVRDRQLNTTYGTADGFEIRNVPCIRRAYVDNEENMANFINELDMRKAYIDRAVYVLENNFLIDFKFFNTYGPSKSYSIDREGEHLISRVNLTLNFELKLTYSSDKNTKDLILNDVKEIIENLNDITSLHMPNLTTDITNKYRSALEYFEFLGFNDLGPGVQHLYRHDYDDVWRAPEFLTIHINEDFGPDINIRLA